MAKSKEVSSKSVQFAKGGSTKMFGSQHAAPQKSGESGHNVSGSGGKFAAGGSTKMFPFRASAPAKPGCSAPD